MLLDALAIGLDAHRAVLAEAVAAVRDQACALQEVVREQGLVDVELEVAAGATEVDRHVVTEDLRAEHGHGLRLSRVDLAWHDRAAGLIFRDRNLAETAAGTGSQ